MKISLFGKEIFSFQSNNYGPVWIGNARDHIKDSKTLPDFYAGRGGLNDFSDSLYTYAVSADLAERVDNIGKIKKKKVKKEEKVAISPKGVYELKLLNQEGFTIKTDSTYIEGQLAEFTDRLGTLKKSTKDMENGIIEVSSIVIRLENRKRYEEFHDFYSQFAYTLSTKIAEVLKKNTHLQIGSVDQFIAEMPNEATKVMREYTKQTQKLCKKDPVFYIIANKEDFRRTDKRKDPILLAQSPFGHFWQILGAWDDEMILLEDL